MSLVRLMLVPHPDIDGGKAGGVYVESRNVIIISRGTVAYRKEGAAEAHRQALWALYDEVTRVNDEAQAMRVTLVPDNEEEAKESNRWMVAREAAQSLNTAYKLVAGELKTSAASSYPAVECTIVSLACGTALEAGVMLSQVYVTESPDQVAELLRGPVRGIAAPPAFDQSGRG